MIIISLNIFLYILNNKGNHADWQHVLFFKNNFNNTDFNKNTNNSLFSNFLEFKELFDKKISNIKNGDALFFFKTELEQILNLDQTKFDTNHFDKTGNVNNNNNNNIYGKFGKDISCDAGT
jgi:hypothetical protein